MTLRAWVELLASMRFAVSLLLLICVASLIGTVLAQNQPANTYVDQFGPFWFALFDAFSIWQVYNSAWFLLIMGFLVLSTSLCLVRNAPRMVRDMRSFREQVRVHSLKALPHHVEATMPVAMNEVLRQTQQWLTAQGYRCRLRQQAGNGLLAAKKGSANRLGYFFAHIAIVMICVGGLLDSELPVRLQVWWADKQPVTDNMLIAQVPESGRLSETTLSFRGNIFLADGSQTRHGIVSVGKGVLVQPLPFLIKLERFYIDYYSTGMPSSFKSDVEVTDLRSQHRFTQTIAVNEPLRYRGVTVYQSSFDDGGSRVSVLAYPLTGSAARPQVLEGVIGQTMDVPAGLNADMAAQLAVDLTALRVFNVENLAANTEPQPRSVREHVAAVTGSAVAGRNENLQNIGPSVQYRTVDRSGQAHEYHQYMLPLTLDGQDGLPVFLAGVRQPPEQIWRYMRIPADANRRMDEFMHLRAALQRPSARRVAAQQFAARHAAPSQREALERAALGALESFARAGFNELVGRIPEPEREKVLGLAVPMIQLTLQALYEADRQARGLPALAGDGQSQGQEATEQQTAQQSQWIRLALLALANLPDWPAPVLLQLQSFDLVQASVFQVTRSPGKYVVYLGCLMLIVGIFAMFYIRDRRVWVWVQGAGDGAPDGSPGGSQLVAAMSTHKRTLDFVQEFDRLREWVARWATDGKPEAG